MSQFLNNIEGNHFWEHYNFPKGEDVTEIFQEYPKPIFFLGKSEKRCVDFLSINDRLTLHTSYYVGVDWIDCIGKAIYVEPKLNKKFSQTNYLKMLFSALRYPDAFKEVTDLFEIKFDSEQIEIEQKQDLLTPLLVIQFLKLTQDIVRKGLKKSYYRVQKNLTCKVKGKLLVSKTIKHNVVKNKELNTFCEYDEFGIDGLENRLLKKALIFSSRYMSVTSARDTEKSSRKIFDYIMPAFEMVSEDISMIEIENSKVNAFYKEYAEAIKLAKIILRRFGYNINSTQENIQKTHPFWIDMSKLFELYVLGLLKDRFNSNSVKYHYYTIGNELDYLLNSEKYKVVIDAKYRPLYKESYDIIDIRQISGYARIQDVYDELEKEEDEAIDCLIIYPDQKDGVLDLKDIDILDSKFKIEQFSKFYKVGVQLPIMD